MKQATLNKLSYKSFGQQLQQDIIEAVVEVDGEEYTHPVPNVGWSYQVPSLQLFGYLGLKPSDFKYGSVDVEATVPVSWNEDHQSYLIVDQIFIQGVQALSEAEWFDSDGDVHDNGGSMGYGGMSVEPGTGNQGAVEIEADGEE